MCLLAGEYYQESRDLERESRQAMLLLEIRVRLDKPRVQVLRFLKNACANYKIKHLRFQLHLVRWIYNQITKDMPSLRML